MILKKNIAEEYRTYLENLGLHIVTVEKYSLYLGHFIKLFDYQLTQKFLDNFLTLKSSPNHRAMMKHLLDFLKRDDSLSPEQQLELGRLMILKQRGRKVKKEKPTLTKDQITKIINEGDIQGHGFRTGIFRLMVLFQYQGGLRISELCGLRWKMIKESQAIGEFYRITLPANITKFSKEAPIYIKRSGIESYQEFFDNIKKQNPKFAEQVSNNQKTLWFDTTVSWFERNFTKQVMRILGIKRTSHSLRHSRPTHLLKEGMPLEQVQKFMRHDDPSSTMIYLHEVREQLEESLKNTTLKQSTSE